VSNYLWDLLAGTGLLLLAAGLWWLYPPLCLIVLGGLGIAFGLYGARLWARDRTRPPQD
jgi:uncharacterized membrane protein